MFLPFKEYFKNKQTSLVKEKRISLEIGCLSEFQFL